MIRGSLENIYVQHSWFLKINHVFTMAKHAYIIGIVHNWDHAFLFEIFSHIFRSIRVVMLVKLFLTRRAIAFIQWTPLWTDSIGPMQTFKMAIAYLIHFSLIRLNNRNVFAHYILHRKCHHLHNLAILSNWAIIWLFHMQRLTVANDCCPLIVTKGNNFWMGDRDPHYDISEMEDFGCM